ncbi:hypothetical protein V8E55_010214 [Tylopilus felleus]
MSNVDNSTPTKFDTSPRSVRFQPAVDQIPTPGTEYPRPPRYEPLILNFWVVCVVCLLMIFLGIALQIVLFFSETQNGFPVPAKNVFSSVSIQTLTSFFPTLLAVPLAHYWTSSDWLLRYYQPYVMLSQGSTPAARSILLDYVASNQLLILGNSWMYKHYLIHFSALMALGVIFLQPLAGSLLQVRQVPHTSDSEAFITNTVALSPTISNLDGFLASSGFAIASIYDNLIDPPFVNGVWAAGQFQPPSSDSYLNATLAVNTTAIRTEVNCANPSSLNVTNEGGNYVASATFPSGCSASNSFNPSNGTQQFSVVAASSCASSGLAAEFQPVVFWFYLNSTSPQVASIYCNPTIDVWQVQTSMNLTTAALGPCTDIGTAQGTNNVTGSPLNGSPYNGVVFTASEDPFVSARAEVLNFALPDAVFRFASRQPGGPLSVFQTQNGFLNATSTIYTQYLAVAAKINYFVAGNSTAPAQLTTYVPRLFIEALPALILSPLLIVIGLVGFGTHLLHRRSRRNLWLTTPPGSIASIVALTSRSGFGQLLLPYDDQKRMQENLAGLTFRMDERTGAIVAEDDFGAGKYTDGVALLGRQRPYGEPTLSPDSTPLKHSGEP